MQEKIYTITVNDGVFTMTFVAPKQLLLNPEWEQMVWDQALRMAHESGHVPVGPIHITYEEGEPPPTAELREGESLTDRIRRWDVSQSILGPVLAPDLIKVTAQVQIGLSL